MNRQLLTYIDQAFVGTLSENTGIWSFEYDPTWIRDGFELSPGLPLRADPHVDGGTVRPVQWFFDNLLPEDEARRQIMALMQRGLSIGGVDAWTMLSQYGAESAGALTLVAPGAALPEAGLVPLSSEALDARIKAMPRQPLAASAPKKMSLAGAQQKLAVVVLDGELYEPIGPRASSHILKPNALSAHYPNSAVNEWFSARLAQRLGLNVPAVELRFVPSPVYLIERFDRRRYGDEIERLHALDALQLLTMSSAAKYSQSGIRALTDILAKCRTPAPARLALFRWTLFNILIGNSDAHLKNISLLAGQGGYELAPHYDLLSTGAWSSPDLLGQGEPAWPDIEMSFPIADVHNYNDLRKEHLEEFARQLGLGPTPFKREFSNMVGRIEAEAEALYVEFEGRADVPVNLRASHLKMLRSIRFLPIQTMVKLLQENG